MTSALSRQVYFETGLEVLSDLGYGGLKLAEVCGRLGVTSGSFYHYFSNWSDYTHELVEHWRQESTTTLIESMRRQPDPRRRIDWLIHNGLHLPHRAEAAIRTWSGVESFVQTVQEDVDRQRHNFARESATEILHDDRQAQVFADWAMFLLIGYEQCSLPKDRAALEWIAGQLLDCLDSGRFSTVPAASGLPEDARRGAASARWEECARTAQRRNPRGQQ